jgi:hypothetical protein
MKMRYIKPEIDINQMAFESSLLAGSGLTGGVGNDEDGIENGGNGSGKEGDSNRSKLWDEPEAF